MTTLDHSDNTTTLQSLLALNNTLEALECVSSLIPDSFEGNGELNLHALLGCVTARLRADYDLALSAFVSHDRTS